VQLFDGNKRQIDNLATATHLYILCVWIGQQNKYLLPRNELLVIHKEQEQLVTIP
jgi:hypothetical protein